jgi:hypothetical protein
VRAGIAAGVPAGETCSKCDLPLLMTAYGKGFGCRPGQLELALLPLGFGVEVNASPLFDQPVGLLSVWIRLS